MDVFYGSLNVMVCEISNGLSSDFPTLSWKDLVCSINKFTVDIHVSSCFWMDTCTYCLARRNMFPPFY